MTSYKNSLALFSRMAHFFIASLILILSTNTYAAWPFSSECSDAESTDKPNWVSQSYDYSEPGYRFGFGEARSYKEATYQMLLDEAEGRALEDIVSSIQVIVSTKTGVTTLVESEDGQESIKRKTDSNIETSSYIDLPGLSIHRQWQDAETCTVYVQVRISESRLSVVLKKSQADMYFKDAQDEGKSISKRLLAISEAIRLAKTYDFRVISSSKSSEQLIREYKHLQQQLDKISSKNNNAVFVINHSTDTNQQALSPIADSLKSSMSGSFEIFKACNSPTLCLDHAGKTPANFASIADVKLNTVKQNGFWVGDFTIELTLWDLSDNTKKYHSGVLGSKVMNRHKHKLTLNKAMKKWLKVYDHKLEEFKTIASTIE